MAQGERPAADRPVLRLCWRGQHERAVASICKLKRIAREEKAQIWPKHDFAFSVGSRFFRTGMSEEGSGSGMPAGGASTKAEMVLRPS
jgi:hypothetical protein